ncbi:UPF0613 protein [Galdieria sulphuraria]|nr:UPF0613 protein [Galdieria sulphuraria]
MSIPSENIPLDSIIYTNRIPGELCLYDEHKHLAAFVAYPGSKALVIFIAGLTDGLFSPRYWGPMAKALHSQGFTCVQPILSSSYHGFGTSSLDQDVMELDTLIDFLSQHYEPSCIFLIGHSTGCQDAVTFFRKAIETFFRPETLLNGKLFTTVFPVLTARRFLSLAERLGDDDMFSYDLTDDELDSRLRHMRNVPTLALFCEKDEAIPNHISYPELAKRLCNVMGATSYMLSNANHAINNSEQCIRDFIEQVVHFIHKVYSSTSE